MIDSPASQPVSSFAEIRQLFPELPGPDEAARTAVAAREARLTKPAGALGRLEEITAWLAAWQGHSPRLEHPRTCVFAANHGVAARGVSAFPPEVTSQMVVNFRNGGAAVNQLCRSVNADLRVYEMNLETPTQDFTQQPAMDEEECSRAIAYGMLAVEQGLDVLCLGEMGIGNTTSAAAICLALFGGEAADWTGPGTGVEGAGMQAKIATVAEGLARHHADLAAVNGDPLEVLRRLGGLELAAIVGAILAARLARIPILLDGYVCTAAAAVVHQALPPGGLDHCLLAHCSAEPGHRRLAQALGMTPLLDLNMRLGEASGATLAVSLLQSALACHHGMATFDDAAVSGPAEG